jgi:hypothetical protein
MAQERGNTHDQNQALSYLRKAANESGQMFISKNLADVKREEMGLLNHLGRHDEALNIAQDLLRQGQGQPQLTAAGAQGATSTIQAQIRGGKSYVGTVDKLLKQSPSLDPGTRRDLTAGILHGLAYDASRSDGPASTARGMLEGKAYGPKINSLARQSGLGDLAESIKQSSVGEGDKAGQALDRFVDGAPKAGLNTVPMAGQMAFDRSYRQGPQNLKHVVNGLEKNAPNNRGLQHDLLVTQLEDAPKSLNSQETRAAKQRLADIRGEKPADVDRMLAADRHRDNVQGAIGVVRGLGDVAMSVGLAYAGGARPPPRQTYARTVRSRAAEPREIAIRRAQERSDRQAAQKDPSQQPRARDEASPSAKPTEEDSSFESAFNNAKAAHPAGDQAGAPPKGPPPSDRLRNAVQGEMKKARDRSLARTGVRAHEYASILDARASRMDKAAAEYKGLMEKGNPDPARVKELGKSISHETERSAHLTQKILQEGRVKGISDKADASAFKRHLASTKQGRKDMEARLAKRPYMVGADRVKAMSEVGEDANSSAHDLNNLLTITGGYGQMATGPSPSKEGAQEIQNGVRRIHEMTEAMHDGASGVPSRQHVQDLGEIADGVRSARADDLQANHIQLKTDVEPGLKVQAPAGAIRRIVDNFVLNAQQAMQDWGGQRSITIAGRRLGDQIEMRVTDTGPGLKPEVEKKLFNEVYTTKANGNGKGTYGSRRMIDKLGGKIGVNSQLGKGASFYFLLPAYH